MDDEAQCVIQIANLIHCDSESHSEVYFGKEDCWGPVCVTVCLCVCVCEALKIHMIKTWANWYIYKSWLSLMDKFVREHTGFGI